jgi:putative resolvase
MKLAEWARLNGVSKNTASKLFEAGDIPGARRLSTGTILVEPIALQVTETIGYARVSSADQKKDLERQADRIRTSGVSEVVCEIGSGLNGTRVKLRRLLQRNCNIVVEHRERLTRFGFEYLQAALKTQGRKLIVLDDKEIDNDLVRDVTEVLTSFCARLYGKRAAANRAARALKCAASESSES